MLGRNIGIDLGTTSVIVYLEGKGIIMSEPSVVAYRKTTGKIMAVGRKAYDMVGKESRSVEVIRPMRDGVVSDFSVTEQMLRYFIRIICKNEIFKPNIIVSMPGTVTNLERRTILDVITASGAGKACLMEEPLAAAIGAGVDTMQPNGVMIVDLGGGTTDVAVITMGSMAVASSIKVAGNTLNESIEKYCRRERNVLKGKDYISGMPVEFEINSDEIYYCIRENIRAIVDSVTGVLERTPPELAGDIMEEGIILTGGTAQLLGLDKVIEEATHIHTRIADDPVNCVARGIGAVLGDLDILVNNGYLFMSRQDISGVTNEKEDYYDV